MEKRKEMKDEKQQKYSETGFVIWEIAIAEAVRLPRQCLYTDRASWVQMQNVCMTIALYL